MFGIGIIEVFVVLMIALFVIGPEKLPETARYIGKSLRTLRQYINEIKRSVNGDSTMMELQNQTEFDIPELVPTLDEEDNSLPSKQNKKK
jgi:sec-independent protein translocase protein TatB